MLSLSLLKKHMQQKLIFSLEELSIFMQEDKIQIENMLAFFIRRGEVIEYDPDACAQSSCKSCKINPCKYFQWVKNKM